MITCIKSIHQDWKWKMTSGSVWLCCRASGHQSMNARTLNTEKTQNLKNEHKWINLLVWEVCVCVMVGKSRKRDESCYWWREQRSRSEQDLIKERDREQVCVHESECGDVLSELPLSGWDPRTSPASVEEKIIKAQRNWNAWHAWHYHPFFIHLSSSLSHFLPGVWNTSLLMCV